MPDGCMHNCIICGKCTRRSFPVLDSFNISGSKLTPREGFGIAVDIGTTSVVMALLDLSSGSILARHSFLNPQRKYGVDVISRISAANEGNLEALRLVITESITAGVRALIKSCSLEPSQIIDMTIAGNTVMTYLLLGIPCASLGVYPFKPEYELDSDYDYRGIFNESRIDCPVRIVPWLAAFVGGDITAGLIYALAGKYNRFMLVDLGTNGEMALYDNGNLTVTSTAAGPAFEGGNHRGGASGVLDDLAYLVRDGFVDETGKLTSIAPPVFTQKEIRELQLAKSGVRSGLEILLESSALGNNELDIVFLAGGIGQAMNTESARIVGLLPQGMVDKVSPVGNSALGGAVRLLLAPDEMAVADKLKAAVVEINLASHPLFNDYFMENMYFRE